MECKGFFGDIWFGRTHSLNLSILRSAHSWGVGGMGILQAGWLAPWVKVDSVLQNHIYICSVSLFLQVLLCVLQ